MSASAQGPKATESTPRKGLLARLESSRPRRQPFTEYRRFVQRHYDGFAGMFTRFTGWVTGHETLAGRLIRPQAFDVRGCKRILDAGCGNGRYTRFVLRDAAADALITAFDISHGMLRRAQARLRSDRVSYVSADLTRLPYPDSFFDAVICGWVLEHLPDPAPGLRELARVLQPGGKLLLLVTEDTILGTMCSRMWHCRTYNRETLQRLCLELGLRWVRPLWFSPLHARFRLGGIIGELRRQA